MYEVDEERILVGKKKKEENKGQNYVTLHTAFYSLA